jgi:hypothetical protein
LISIVVAMVVAAMFAVFNHYLFDDDALRPGAFFHDHDFLVTVSRGPGVGIAARHAEPDRGEKQCGCESFHAWASWLSPVQATSQGIAL